MSAAFAGLGGLFWIFAGIAAFNEHAALTVFFGVSALAAWEANTESALTYRLGRLIELKVSTETPEIRALVAINDRLDRMDQRLVEIRSEIIDSRID